MKKNISESAKKEDSFDYSKNEILLNFDKIENTPFTIASDNEGCWIIMGNYRLTEGKISGEEAQEWIDNITWNKIIQIILCMIDFENKMINLPKKGQ